MRVAAWIVIVCAVLAGSGVFLPALEVRVEGVRVKRASLSLYRAAIDREAARALLGKYARLGRKHDVEAAADAALEHARHGAAKLHVDDARDAMSTLDDITDSDALLVGRALAATTFGFLALELLALACVFGDTMRGTYRRWRAHVALALATLGAAIGVAIVVGCREVAWQANDELGASALSLGVGPVLIAAGALGTLGGAIALVVAHVKSRRAQRHAEPA